MLRSILALAALAIALVSGPAWAWGPTGHRMIALIAQHNISGRTRAQVREILGTEELPEAATFPDDQRINPDPFWQNEASPLHFVTVPEGKTAAGRVRPPVGDAVTALERFTQVLRNPTANRADKLLALRFVVHIVGDLHMPLHAHKPGDDGASGFKVTWFGAPDTLHWVWDNQMIMHQGLSFTEYAARLEARTTSEQVVQWWDPRPATWIDEDVALRDRIIPPTGAALGTEASPVKLADRYAFDWTPTMERRLQQAGVRTAAYLDWIFAGAR